MPRAKRGFKARRRRNRVLKHASGYHSARSRLFAYAQEVVRKAWVYAYAHRKRKKRDFRRLWIARINAAARAMAPDTPDPRATFVFEALTRRSSSPSVKLPWQTVTSRLTWWTRSLRPLRRPAHPRSRDR